jgi:hypothetical protein
MQRSSIYPWTYLASLIGGWRERHEFRDVATYAMFIGQPRSGTTLVGSLLNAHRQICIAQELNALRYVQRGYGRHQLYWLLRQRDAEFEQNGRVWTGYNYDLPGQWQGRTDRLQVIGDKKAGMSTDLLDRCPELLTRLQHLLRVPIRMVHVVRNPFNVIATTHCKRKRTPLPLAISMYFSRCAANWRLMQDPRCQIETFQLEKLIADPRPRLIELCRFLGVQADDDYLEACSQKLFSTPRQSQREVAWSAALVDAVYQHMQDYPFLRGYQFQGDVLSRAA